MTASSPLPPGGYLPSRAVERNETLAGWLFYGVLARLPGWLLGWLLTLVLMRGGVASGGPSWRTWQIGFADHLLDRLNRHALAGIRQQTAENGSSIGHCLVRLAAQGQNRNEQAYMPWATLDLVSASDRQMPADPLDAASLLVIALQGADPRQVLRFLPGNEPVRVLALGQRQPRHLPPRLDLLERGRRRSFNGYGSHDAIRLACDAALLAMRNHLPERQAQLATRIETALSNELMTEIDRFMLQIVDMQVEVLAQKPDKILILEGDQDSRTLITGLSEIGIPRERIVLASASPLLSAMRAFANRNAGHDNPEDAPATQEHAIENRFNRARRALRMLVPLWVTGCSLVFAGTNGRHLPPALKAMEALAAHWPVRAIVMDIAVHRTVFGEVWRIFRRLGWRRYQCWALPSPQTQHHHGGKPDWSLPLVMPMLEAANAREGTQALHGAIRQGLEAFLAQHLLPMLVLADYFETQFRRWRPANVVLVPGTHLAGMIAAHTADALDIPSIEIQTLLTQENGREYRPVARLCGVIDTSQAELFTGYFKHPADRILLTGYIDAVPDDLTTTPTPSEQKSISEARISRTVLLISQPLPELIEQAAEMLVDALIALPDHRGILASHPRETREQLTKLSTLVEKSSLGERFTHIRGGTPWQDVLDADVVICLYSNLGIKAAAASKDVLVIDPTDEGLPCRFERMGIAGYARSGEEIIDFLKAMNFDSHERRQLAQSRARYFEVNRQLEACDGIDRMIAALKTPSHLPPKMG